MTDFTSTSTAGTPRSVRDQLFVVDNSSTVTSPYYAGPPRTVSDPTYSYSPVLSA